MTVRAKIVNGGLLVHAELGGRIELTTADAVELLGQLTGLIPTMHAPELILAYADPEKSPVDSYLCPHCAGVHPFDQAGPTLTEVDADVRHNDAYVTDDGGVWVKQGEKNYATMIFLCGFCRGPVSLPTDTEVTHD